MEEIKLELSLTDEEKYQQLLPQIDVLINPEDYIISNLSNVTAVLKQCFNKISWVGFYLLKNNKLYLGPFQGKIACTEIEIGKGVCGTSVIKKETIIVEDVNKFPGHIACDSESKSEIVVPLMKENKIYGVLDLDSISFSSFDKVDKFYLEELCRSMVSKLNFDKFVLS